MSSVTRDSIADLVSAGKKRAVYNWPTAQSSVPKQLAGSDAQSPPETALIPSFHRARRSLITSSKRSRNCKRASRKERAKQGEAVSRTLKASHALSVSSGVSAKICAIAGKALFSPTTMRLGADSPAPVRNASHGNPGANADSCAGLYGL